MERWGLSIVDLERIAALLSQRQHNHSLPQAFYQDPEILAFDLEVLAGSWLLAGFEVEVAEPGSAMTFTAGMSSVIIVRDKDGTLRGFHNSCRHRGSEIISGSCKKLSRLTCPYHQWSYGLDGKLMTVPRMVPGFDRDAHSLGPVHVETAAGIVFVCLADTPPPFEQFRAQTESLLAPHHLLNAKVATTLEVVEKANWKLVMENARECYHCYLGHPDLRASFPVGYFLAHNNEEAVHTEKFRARMATLGLPTGPHQGEWWEIERFRLNDGCLSISMDGKPVSQKLMCETGAGDIGSVRLAVEPHNFAHFVSDYVASFSAMPLGPQETLVTLKFLVHKDAVEGVDYDLKRLTDTWWITNDQDRVLAENNQRGVNSRGYRPGPYSEDAEGIVIRFMDFYCRRARQYLDSKLDGSPRLAAVAGGAR